MTLVKLSGLVGDIYVNPEFVESITPVFDGHIVNGQAIVYTQNRIHVVRESVEGAAMIIKMWQQKPTGDQI